MGRWCERGEGNKGGWEMGTREGGGLRTKSRARTPDVLGNTISLSNTTSESREVVADVGGTTGVDEARATTKSALTLCDTRSSYQQSSHAVLALSVMTLLTWTRNNDNGIQWPEPTWLRDVTLYHTRHEKNEDVFWQLFISFCGSQGVFWDLWTI